MCIWAVYVCVCCVCLQLAVIVVVVVIVAFPVPIFVWLWAKNIKLAKLVERRLRYTHNVYRACVCV